VESIEGVVEGEDEKPMEGSIAVAGSLLPLESRGACRAGRRVAGSSE